MGGLMVSLLAAIVAGFFATLALAPRLPELKLQDPRILSALHDRNAKRLNHKAAWARVPKPGPGRAVGSTKPLTVGFYVSWDVQSRQSLSEHLGQIDVVAPQWIALKGGGGAIDFTDDPQAVAMMANAGHPVSVLPVVFNAAHDQWFGDLADHVILDPVARRVLINNLVQLAAKRGFSGYIFDFEDLSPAALDAYPGFIAEANAALQSTAHELWVTAPFDDPEWPLQKLQNASDSLMLMAYDQHWATGDPGPAAGQDWYESWLEKHFSKLDPAKIVLALGAYGYDWTKRAPGETGRADAVTFHEAIQTAHDSDGDIVMDDNALNPHFGYADEKGREHQVWFLDAPALFNQVKVADEWKPRGYALWRLGSEDPGVWSVLGGRYGQASTAAMSVLSPGPDVDFDGTGEVLHVAATPNTGHRTMTFDPDTGLVADEHYDTLPSSYVIQRYGAHPGWVALTFDDGPDPRWTPKLLKILKEKNAPATFFVVGKNMQEHPGIVRREIAQGMVVGSHSYTHPNIAALPVAETDLELNATQRLFEVITGQSMRLFRPPYFGDAEPSTPAEVNPLITAQKLGYLIVGLRIDPDDWKKPDATLIVQRTLARLADPNPETGGQVVLLHDAGGDRTRTIAALPDLIDALRAHGYKLVTVAQLAGMTTAEAMPPTQRQWLSLTLDRIGFDIFREIDFALKTLFISAIALGLLRLVFLAALALIHNFRHDKRKPPNLDPETGPLVSVLIPCFNEEKVIASSVARILESRWANLEVIVLDDGSTDRTAEEVERRYANHARVKLMRFANGGKAEALNKGLKEAKGEIVVALDADTLFAPKTIGRLARWFVDPEVGAVAGNALVGNRVNLITRWQALEYVTAQNLERRALAALGAVTVVPGAVGAWRKSALEALGGYPIDTLAEDQDLTIAVQRAGWRVEFDPGARAYTEAPDTVEGLLKQRFRWSFGTLQCLWKHREALFNPKHPVLGFVALPQIWLFQIFLAVAAPLVDLAVVWSLISAALDHFFHPVEWSSDKMVQALAYWAVFIFVDLSAAALGMAMERRAPWRDMLWIPIQRFGYRQLMYYVVVKAVVTAVRGPRVGWGRLERRGTAAVESEPRLPRSPASRPARPAPAALPSRPAQRRRSPP